LSDLNVRSQSVSDFSSSDGDELDVNILSFVGDRIGMKLAKSKSIVNEADTLKKKLSIE
jgi:hypothetical protein